MNIFIFATMHKGKRNIVLIALALFALLVCGCADLKDIKVTSCSVKSVMPSGLRSIQGLLALGIDDPSIGFTLSGIEGIVKYNDRVVGNFSGGPVSVDGHSSQVYDMNCTATLSKDVSLAELFAWAANKNFDGFTTDFSAKVRVPWRHREDIEIQGCTPQEAVRQS
jgi:hypothetical protein